MANDLWATPYPLFNNLDKEYNFEIDICAHPKTTKVSRYFTEKEDSLSFPWWILTNGWIWCNPPYSDPLPWVKQAVDAQLHNTNCVMILNDDPSVEWFYIAKEHASKIIHITGYYDDKGDYKNGRIHFLDGNGQPCKQNNKPQVIFEFDSKKIGQNLTKYIPKNILMKS